MLEKKIEQALCKRVKELGGLCDKFKSPGKRAVPDRVVTLPNNRIIFVELKRPGEEPTPLQLKDHKKRRALGCDVRVIDSLEGANAFPN